MTNAFIEATLAKTQVVFTMSLVNNVTTLLIVPIVQTCPLLSELGSRLVFSNHSSHVCKHRHVEHKHSNSHSLVWLKLALADSSDSTVGP